MSVFTKHNIDKSIIRFSKNLLTYSRKVLHYRKHLMSTPTFLKISDKQSELRLALLSKNFKNLKSITQQLHELLTQNGGDIYPVRVLNDNCEVLLVASIIAIAIRAFFVQTFQIPTNSMYPTYAGITTHVHEKYIPKSSSLRKLYNKIFNGTSTFYIEAEHTGQIEIPLFTTNQKNKPTGIVKFDISTDNKFLGIFPQAKRIYHLKIKDKTQDISIPVAYSLDDVFLKKFGLGFSSWQKLCDKYPEKFKIIDDTIFYKTGHYVKTKEQLINFDIICGDMLFVDKFSYHFRKPSIGEAIVFRTEKIKNIPGDPHYFIKRLTGISGDKIQLKNGILYRNDNPIDGSQIFNYENTKSNGYLGYTEAGSLRDNHTILVENKKYFVLGDNSPDSGDSRFWGFVPETEVNGKPLLIFYPLNRIKFCK